MKVRHLDCGKLMFPGLPLSVHCLLVEAPDGLVLVDAGLGLPDITGNRLPLHIRQTTRRSTPQDAAISQVVSLGHRATDVKHIVVTHLDLDHAGALTDFPQATVHVLAPELAAAQAPQTFMERRRYIPAQLQGVRFAPAEATTTLFGMPATGPLPGLPDSIRLVSLPGHSPGHAGVAVEGEGGWVMHCGDAWFFREDLTHAGPLMTRAFQRAVASSVQTMLATRTALHALETTGEVRLCNTHDAADLVAHQAS